MKHTKSTLALALAGLMLSFSLVSCGGGSSSSQKAATADDARNAAAIMYNCYVLGNADLPQACEDFVKEYEALNDELKEEVDGFLDDMLERQPGFADFLAVKGIRPTGETPEQMGYRYYTELYKTVKACEFNAQDSWKARIKKMQRVMDEEQRAAFQRGIDAFKADNPGAKFPMGM